MMLLTALGFFALTALLTVRHLRKTVTAVTPGGPPCPRCGVSAPVGSAYCPACGVPMQVYELVTSRPVAEQARTPARGPLHAVVRADVCVGCGTCVAACPEDGALALRGKIATVDTGKCLAHGKCAEACPVGAIVVTAGTAVQRVEVPDVGAGFQSNVPGVYIVGELGGRGLIRNAVNEGALAIEHIAREAGASRSPASAGAPLDVIIVGSGPAGLSAALASHRAGLSYVVLETGDLAASVRRYPRHKLLVANASMTPVYGGLWVGDATKETLLRIWQSIIDENQLKILTGHRVETVRKSGDLFHVVAAGRAFPARRVVLATGRRGTPRRLGVPGEDLPSVFYDIVEMEHFTGHRVVVVGGGDSAIESALGLSNQAGTTVTLLHRGERFDRAQSSLVGKLVRASKARRLSVLLRVSVREIREGQVVAEISGVARPLACDTVIVRIGGEPPTALLRSAGVRMVAKDLALAPPEPAPDRLRLPLLASLIVGTTLSAVRAQVSPGPLAEPHASLGTAVGCFDCHGKSKGAMRDRCLACHEEIAWLIKNDLGYHARKGRDACQTCHPDHAGRGFEMVHFAEGSPEKFDHETSGFPLEGRHAETKCRDCHQPRYERSPARKLSKRKRGGEGWIGLERACVSCHEDVHRGVLGTDCRACHDLRAWKPASAFDHAKTAYPLTGKHGDVPCAKCHMAPGRTQPLYKPLPHAECSSCHLDPHKGQLGPACAKCHVTVGWVRVDPNAFDHDKTRYPLRGKHTTVKCASCHDPVSAWGKKPPFASCNACHKDPHAGAATVQGRAVDCASCHRLDGFRPSGYTVAQHATSKYPLEGKHQAVRCSSCHTKAPKGSSRPELGPAGVLIRPAHARCRGCHEDAHGDQLASRPDRGACEPCHAVAGWKPSTYSAEKHATLRVALTGRHAAIECAACHGAGRKGLPPLPAAARLGSAKVAFVLTETACASCHHDPHAGRFEAAGARPHPGGCVHCHGVDAFRPSLVDVPIHGRFAYPLAGAHRATACDACHVESKLAAKRSSLVALHGPGPTMTFATKSQACEACHATPHGDQFAARNDRGACDSCHGDDSFRPAGRFDHQKDASFPLDGAHVRVACARCHASRPGADGKPLVLYRSLPHRCEDCHRAGGMSPPLRPKSRGSEKS